MKQFINTIIKSFLIALALTAAPLTALARDSLEALRNDLNAAVNRIDAQQAQINNLQAQITALTPVTYAIGDTGPAGGIVYYLTYAGQHGLEAAPADQQSWVEWGCDGRAIDGANNTAVGTGAQNTQEILANCNVTSSAALYAINYTLGEIHDWYLPSKDELALLYLHRAIVGRFGVGCYWSSSETDSQKAWSQNFETGAQLALDKYVDCRVRAIRSF